MDKNKKSLMSNQYSTHFRQRVNPNLFIFYLDDDTFVVVFIIQEAYVILLGFLTFVNVVIQKRRAPSSVQII